MPGHSLTFLRRYNASTSFAMIAYHRFAFFVLCTFTIGSLASAENWNQYLGPNGNGHSAVKELPETWSEKENVRWKIPVAGKAWSSPVVWGEQIWRTNANEGGTKMGVVCVDFASGNIVHDRVLFDNEEPDFCHAFNSYASCTPFIEAGRIYVHFGKYGTACLSTETAEVIWQRRDFKCDHWRGPGSSPIVHDGLLFVCYDGFENSSPSQKFLSTLDAWQLLLSSDNRSSSVRSSTSTALNPSPKNRNAAFILEYLIWRIQSQIS